jgi:hypothetical protein
MARVETRDALGNLLFYTETVGHRQSVRNAIGGLLGWVGQGETRDANDNLLYKGEQPGLLYKPQTNS